MENFLPFLVCISILFVGSFKSTKGHFQLRENREHDTNLLDMRIECVLGKDKSRSALDPKIDVLIIKQHNQDLENSKNLNVVIETWPTSVIMVKKSSQPTDSTKSPFHIDRIRGLTHKIRNYCQPAQLLVVASDSDSFLSAVVENTESTLVQTNPNFWYTYERLIFLFEEDAEGEKTVEFLNRMQKFSNLNNVAVLTTKNSDKSCQLEYLCIHCCNTGKHCKKTTDLGELWNPTSTAFNGRTTNGFVMHTTYTNFYKSFFPKRGINGSMAYAGCDYEHLMVFAEYFGFEPMIIPNRRSLISTVPDNVTGLSGGVLGD